MGVRWVRLGEVCDYVDYRGKTPRKTTSGIQLITAKNIRKGFIDYEISKEFIDRNEYEIVMKRGIPKIGDILITTEAPMGNVAQVDNKNIALAQRVIKYSTKNSSILSNNFLRQYLQSVHFQNKLDKKSTGSTIKGIRGKLLHELKIPLPPLERQKEIVEILDKFEKLTNDISQGLPAEITARRKQYEYYRNKLLTFNELP